MARRLTWLSIATLVLRLAVTVIPSRHLTDLIAVFEESHPKQPIIDCSGSMREQISRLLVKKDEVVHG